MEATTPPQDADDEQPDFSLGLRTLTFSDGRSVDLVADSILVLVGPNNSGKTQALRDIQIGISQPETALRPVVPTITVEKSGSGEALKVWLQTYAHETKYAPTGEPRFNAAGGGERLTLLQERWSTGPPFHELSAMVCTLAGAEARLSQVQSAPAFSYLAEPPEVPLQSLLLDPSLEDRLAAATQAAFDWGVTLNRIPGSQIHLHMGSLGEPLSQPPSLADSERLAELPLVSSQGDGVKSFVGLMLTLITGRFSIVLVDEPEAFLHPPQARLLGRNLVAESDSQLCVATHSSDVLQGILSTGSDRVTVVRVTRKGETNPVSVLAQDQIRDLWKDPLLRYSSALDALFHTGAVVCEADSDCRFYEAVLDAELSRNEHRPHDLLFTHCGGKQRLPVIVNALTSVNVPVRVIADIDLLRRESKVLLKQLVAALGGAWDDMETNWTVLEAAVRQHASTAPGVENARARITEVLDGEDGNALSGDGAKRIRAIVKFEDGWAQVKQAGIPMVPAGQATTAATTLLEQLSAVGIFVVPVGELEGWRPAIGGHGPAWVSGALESGVHEQQTGASEFVTRVS